MARRDTPYRRRTKVPVPLRVIGVIGTVVAFRVGLVELSKVIGWLALPVMIAALLGGGYAVGGWLHWWRDRAKTETAADVAQWQATAGWEPVPLDTAWPWAELVRWTETVTVLRAYRKKNVIVGELQWTENAFGEAVDRWEGRAAFAVVTLPEPMPSIAVRAFRHPYRQGDDEFWKRFRLLGAEAISPDLRAAHLNGEIPPWTLRGDQLFFLIPLEDLMHPDDLEKAAATAHHLTELLQNRVHPD